MGSTLLPLTSFRITIGMFVTGSIIRPRIFISSSISASCPSLHHTHHTLSGKRIWTGARDPHGEVLSQQRLAAAIRMGEVQRAILRGAPDPLPQRFIAALDQRFFRGSDQLRVLADLDGPLLFEQDHDT